MMFADRLIASLVVGLSMFFVFFVPVQIVCLGINWVDGLIDNLTRRD